MYLKIINSLYDVNLEDAGKLPKLIPNIININNCITEKIDFKNFQDNRIHNILKNSISLNSI